MPDEEENARRHLQIGTHHYRVLHDYRTTKTRLLPFTYETKRLIRRNPSGKGTQYYHLAARAPTMRGLVAALKQIRTPSVTIRVLGKLAKTPEDYDSANYPAHEYVYLGSARNTANALADAKRRLAAVPSMPTTGVHTTKGNDFLQVIAWCKEWTSTDFAAFDWEDVATIYLSER